MEAAKGEGNLYEKTRRTAMFGFPAFLHRQLEDEVSYQRDHERGGGKKVTPVEEKNNVRTTKNRLDRTVDAALGV